MSFRYDPVGASKAFGREVSGKFKAGAGGIFSGIKQAGKNTTPKIAAEDVIQDVPVVNPYEESLKGALATPTAPDFAKASEIGASQTGLAKQLEGLYGTGAAGMTGLINQLQQQSQGNFGPGGSLAQALLQQGMGQNIAGVRSQLASQRGLSPALAARYAAQQTAALGGQTAQQAGILGLQQQLAAQQQLGELTSQAAKTGGGLAGQILSEARGQEIGQAKTTSEAALQRLQTLSQSDVGMREIAARTGMSANEIRTKIAAANQAAASGDRARRDAIIGSLISAGGQIGASMAAAYSGGRIDGVAQVDGDHPQNDTVPAMLSPGEIVIPRTSAKSKKAAKSFIDSLNDFDEPVGFKDVLKARQKKNFNDGGKVASTFGVTPYSPERSNPETNRMMYQHYMDQVRTQPMAEDKMPWNVPFPPGVEAQRKVDEALSSYVVEPLAKRGYENLGAALAAGPSAAASMIIPQSEFDVAGTIVPLPGVAKVLKTERQAFPELTKAMRAEKKMRDSEEYAEAIKKLRADEPDLLSIKTGSDINVTPGMAKKNFEQSREAAIKQEQFLQGTRPVKENPRSTQVSNLRGGLYGRWDDRDLVNFLNLNKDLPGLDKLIKEREALLIDPYRRTSYFKETPGLRRIESEISKILRENKDKLQYPLGRERDSKNFIPRDVLDQKIRDRDAGKN